MLIRRLKILNARAALFLVLLCICALVFLFWSVSPSFTASSAASKNPVAGVPDNLVELLKKELKPAEIPKSLTPEPNIAVLPQTPSSPQQRLEAAYELIYQGKFEAVGEVLNKINRNSGEFDAVIGQLMEIIDEYQALNQQRQSSRQAAYKQQLAELEKFEARGLSLSIGSKQVSSLANDSKPVPSNGPKADLNTSEGFEIPAPSLSADKLASAEAESIPDVNGVADANDANDITQVLACLAKASELANAAQREELFSKSFVKEVFQKVIDKAAEFELQGKWLDAYTSCYWWLQAIDPNNQAYTDYAQQLLDKAGIVASFADSPCETRAERFDGIKKEMFIRAVEALNVTYVSNIDYGKMAAEAIKRCQLLAEIMKKWDSTLWKSPSFSKNSSAESQDTPGQGEYPFSLPDLSSIALRKVDVNELNALSAALAAMLDEVESSCNPARQKSSQGPKEPVLRSTAEGEFTKDDFLEVFQRVLALNDATVQLPQSVMIAHFSEAAFSALDPYTVIVWPRQVQDFEKIMTNEFTGIGIEISKEKGLLKVMSLLPDTPAYRAGLDAGDVIVTVDGLETKDMSLTCAVRKITGPKGTKVTLAIKRPGEETTKDFTITRAKITVPSIRGWQRTEAGNWQYIIDQQNNIGYVRLTSFSVDTASDLDKVLHILEKEGLKGLILDLRFNSGGLLDSAVDVADMFIKNGLIVSTQPGLGRTPTYKMARERGTHPDFPLVILINSSSASASEIVAGALADKVHKRAILVGTRTHGKGSVQGITSYPGGGAELKYTMSYYHLPSNQQVKSREEVEKQGGKDWGVGPNIDIELTSDELKKMLDFQRDNDVLVQVGRGSSRDSPQRHTIDETLAADPQLAVAVLVVKTKMIQDYYATIN